MSHKDIWDLLTNAAGQPISRRRAIQVLGVAGISAYLPGCTSIFRKEEGRLIDRSLGSISPVNRSLDDHAPAVFAGDAPDHAHWAFRKATHLVSSTLAAKKSPPREKAPVVVVGGGMSGLFTTYLLRAQRPILLEQADRFGGNSKAESWKGTDYPIGAAYFVEPEAGSKAEALYKELGLDSLCTVKKEEDPVLLNGKLYRRFWEGETDPAHAEQFKQISRYFTEIYNETNDRVYPDIPIVDEEKRAYVEKLDQETFQAHLEKVAGGKVHPHIQAAIDHYCSSTFAAKSSEISAAAGLNAYAAEFGNMWVAPGGNAGVAERILERLSASLPSRSLRAKSLVFSVEVVSDGVMVSYLDREGNVHTIQAQKVVMACPKFVARHLLKGIEPERAQAISKLRYRSYLVANVLLRTKLPRSFYDLYMVDASQATDTILADFASPKGEGTVLTLYRGFPQDGVRPILEAPSAYDRYRSEFENQIAREVLPALGVASSSIVDIRMARWGHPMPLAEPGLISGGVIDQIRKPFRDRVFFVEQDNWMFPAFETGLEEAIKVSDYF